MTFKQLTQWMGPLEQYGAVCARQSLLNVACRVWLRWPDAQCYACMLVPGYNIVSMAVDFVVCVQLGDQRYIINPNLSRGTLRADDRHLAVEIWPVEIDRDLALWFNVKHWRRLLAGPELIMRDEPILGAIPWPDRQLSIAV